MNERRHGYVQPLAEILYEMDTGKVAPRTRTYRGVEFRSRLEARFAEHLDSLGSEWVYEPRVYGPAGEGYLPDFQIVDAAHPTFIEVKPTRAEVPEAKRRMGVIRRTHPDALLMVACEEGRTFYVSLGGTPWRTFQERWGS